jgi:hypothetical protein
MGEFVYLFGGIEKNQPVGRELNVIGGVDVRATAEMVKNRP